MSETQRISFSKEGNLYIGNVDTQDLADYTSTVENTVAVRSFNRGPHVFLSISGEFLIVYNHVWTKRGANWPTSGQVLKNINNKISKSFTEKHSIAANLSTFSLGLSYQRLSSLLLFWRPRLDQNFLSLQLY